MTDTIQPVDPSYYDRDYYTSGVKSNYAPYGPGTWADWLTDMIVEHIDPRVTSVLDAGCAYGFIVERLWNRKGIPAWGFDISEFAIRQMGYWSRTWLGDVADLNAWRRVPEHHVDLALTTEVGEHLTPDQARKMLENGMAVADRMLVLVATADEDGHDVTGGDGSHILIRPIEWWADLAQDVGWVVGDASRFNEDWRSSQMGWSGRWLFLTKEA